MSRALSEFNFECRIVDIHDFEADPLLERKGRGARLQQGRNSLAPSSFCACFSKARKLRRVSVSSFCGGWRSASGVFPNGLRENWARWKLRNWKPRRSVCSTQAVSKSFRGADRVTGFAATGPRDRLVRNFGGHNFFVFNDVIAALEKSPQPE